MNRSDLRVRHSLDTREERVRGLVPNPTDAVPEAARHLVVIQRSQARRRVHLADRKRRRVPYALPTSGERDFERKDVQLPVRHRTQQRVEKRTLVEDELAADDLDIVAPARQPTAAVAMLLFFPPRGGKLRRGSEHLPVDTHFARGDLNELHGTYDHTPTVVEIGGRSA